MVSNLSILFLFTSLTCISKINAHPRIVGGFETTIEQRPYQASLQFVIENTHSHGCGATIISTKYLLTAARCNPEHNMKIAYARVGSTMYDRDGQLLKIATFIPHPNYNKTTFDYNFAIISFENDEEIVLGEGVAPIQLASSDDPADGSMLTISGWGITSEDGSVTPFHLREVNLPVFNREKCEIVYENLTDRQICLGGTPDGGTSACTFDFGGPAVQDGILYGVISNGKSCYLPNVPGIYGRVSSVREWIKTVTGV